MTIQGLIHELMGKMVYTVQVKGCIFHELALIFYFKNFNFTKAAVDHMFLILTKYFKILNFTNAAKFLNYKSLENFHLYGN